MNDMNSSEIIREIAERNRTLEILDILRECKDLDEAIEKIKALLINK